VVLYAPRNEVEEQAKLIDIGWILKDSMLIMLIPFRIHTNMYIYI
jgi:hypothetical protein